MGTTRRRPVYDEPVFILQTLHHAVRTVHTQFFHVYLSFSISSIMSHSHASWSDLPPFPHPERSPSVLLPFHSDEQPLDPRTAERSGRLAILSPLTGYEPNTTVEISSAEITLFIFHQGGESSAQYRIPVRPPQLHPCLPKWMKDKAPEGWLHRC